LEGSIAALATAANLEPGGRYQAIGVGLAQIKADGTQDLPLATTVVVDPFGIIRWIDVRPDYSTRSEPTQILAAVDDVLAGEHPRTR